MDNHTYDISLAALGTFRGELSRMGLKTTYRRRKQACTVKVYEVPPEMAQKIFELRQSAEKQAYESHLERVKSGYYTHTGF